MAKKKELIRFDWFIKFMLRDKVDFEILAGFLSELLHEKVEILSVLESESNQTAADDKFNRVDVLVKTADDELVIIEVQNDFEIDFLYRLHYGASKATVEYIKKAEKYGKIKKVISISIVYFDVGQGKDYVYKGATNFIGIHNHDELQLTPEQKMSFQHEKVADIFPTYYLIRAERFPDIVNDKLDQWVYFFKNSEIREDFDAQGLVLANELLDYQKMSPEEKAKYEAYYRKLRDENSWAWSQEVKIQMAVRVALEKENEILALNMYQDGEPISKIVKYTKLSEEHIQELIDQQQLGES